MATRFYFITQAGSDIPEPISGSPAIDSNWERYALFSRQPCFNRKLGTSALADVVRAWPGVTTGQWVWYQWQTEPLLEQYVFSAGDSVRTVLQCAQQTVNTDTNLAFSLRVSSPDGLTVRGTLLWSGEVGTEFSISACTRILGGNFSGDVTAQAGDRLIFELGLHGETPAAENVRIRIGDSAEADFEYAADLTTDLNPWWEISRDVLLGTALTVSEATHSQSADAVSVTQALWRLWTAISRRSAAWTAISPRLTQWLPLPLVATSDSTLVVPDSGMMHFTPFDIGLDPQADGVIISDVYIPNSRDGGNHPHAVDFYVPNGGVTRSAIVLHGGGGNKIQIARLMGLAMTTPITPLAFRWDILNYWNALLVIPQGQACTGTVNDWNPGGVDTRTVDYPDGIRTWTNYQMWSQADDVQFLKDLSDYVSTNYGAGIGKNLCGHSQGGMMVSRMWYEAPTYFTNFCAASSGAPNYFVLNPAVIPDDPKPFHLTIGQLDNILNVQDGPRGAGDHFFEETWEQGASTVALSDVYTPLLYMGAWNALQRMTDIINDFGLYDPQVIDVNDAVETAITIGTKKTWTYGGLGRVKVVWLSDAGHDLASIQACMNQRVFSNWMNFAYEMANL